MASFNIACVVLMCTALVGAHTAQAITCGQVQVSLAPCLGFLQNGGAVPAGCCNGVRSIMNTARTTVDRRAICNCLKVAAGAICRLNPNNSQALPGKCNVNIPYKISTSPTVTASSAVEKGFDGELAARNYAWYYVIGRRIKGVRCLSLCELVFRVLAHSEI